MKRRKIKSSITYFLGIILIISFSYLAYYSYTRSTKKIVSSEVSYSSVDNSSYEVYYSDSKIFSGKSLEESFVQKYTDIIKFDFDYNLNFTAGVSGKSETVVKSYLVIMLLILLMSYGRVIQSTWKKQVLFLIRILKEFIRLVM